MSSYLIIDGYNLIHKIPSLVNAQRKGIEHARDMLFDLVQPYCDYNGFLCVIVYDGQGPSRTEEGDNPKVIFSKSGESADTVIESMIYNSTDKEGIRVVTDDRTLANMATGMGVFTSSAELFEREVKSTLKLINNSLNNDEKL